MTGVHPVGRPDDDRDPADRDEPSMSTAGGRRRGPYLLLAVFLGGIALIFLFMLLVGQLGR